MEIVSGRSLVDPEDPQGRWGNRFTVVIGDGVGHLDDEARRRLACTSGSPETIFVHSVGVPIAAGRGGTLLVRVLTANGTEVGACAHGFLGTVGLLARGRLAWAGVVDITTTLGTAARASVVRADAQVPVVDLELTAQPPRFIDVQPNRLGHVIPGAPATTPVRQPVLSVGTAKLTVELAADGFASVQRSLATLQHAAVLALQAELDVGGIHLFTRDPCNGLPARSIQVNALLGPTQMVDRATGTANAALVAYDPAVPVGQPVRITQYCADGPSAVIDLVKHSPETVTVRGAVSLD